MKTLQHYVPPSPQALRGLQDALGYSNMQMAQLAGLDDQADWQAFIATPAVHRLGKQRVFYMAARLALEPPPNGALCSRACAPSAPASMTTTMPRRRHCPAPTASVAAALSHAKPSWA